MHVFGVQEYPERSHVGTRRTDTSKISSSEFVSPVPTSLSQIVLGILSKSYVSWSREPRKKKKYLSGFFPGFFCDLRDRGHKWIGWANKTSIKLSQHSKVTKANIQTDNNLLLIFIHMDSGWLDVLYLFWSLWHKRFLLFPHSQH